VCGDLLLKSWHCCLTEEPLDVPVFFHVLSGACHWCPTGYVGDHIANDKRPVTIGAILFKGGDMLVTDSTGLALPSPLCSKNAAPALHSLLSHELNFFFLSGLFPCLCPFQCLLLQYCSSLYCYCATGEEEAGMFKRLAAFLMDRCTGRFRAKRHITLVLKENRKQYVQWLLVEVF